MTDFGVWNAVTHSMVTLNDDVQLKDHGLEKAASIIVRENGVYYEAIKGGTSTSAGTIIYGGVDNAGATSGTDAIAVTNAAMGALTAGRIYKETVKLKGAFTFSGAALSIPSYTTLDLTEAHITLAYAALDVNFWAAGAIENSDTVGGNEQIDIFGGVIDNDDMEGCMFFLKNVTGFRVIGTTFTQTVSSNSGGINILSTNGVIANCTFKNIWILNITTPSTGIKVRDNFFEDMYDSPVSIGAVTATVVSDVIVEGNTMSLTGQTLGWGVDVFGNVKHIRVRDNHITDSFYEGVVCHINTEEVTHYYPEDVLIDGNTIINARRAGIKVEGAAAHQSTFQSIMIRDNDVMAGAGSTEACIYIIDSGGVTIEGNTLDGNAKAELGIAIIADNFSILDTDQPVIERNRIRHCSVGIYFEAAAGKQLNAIVCKNDLSVDNTSMLSDGGGGTYNIVLRDNMGFTTENEGYGEIVAAATTTVATALIGDATYFSCAFYGNMGFGEWKWTAGSPVTVTVTNIGNYTFRWRAYYSLYNKG